jgi:hypothetical protein
MGRATVEFHHRQVRRVVPVAVGITAALAETGLPGTFWQAVRALDVAVVAVLQNRVHPLGIWTKQRRDLGAPGHLRPQFHGLVQLGLRRQAPSQGPCHPGDRVVQGARGAHQVEHGLLDAGLGRQQHRMPRLRRPGGAVNYYPRQPCDPASFGDRDVGQLTRLIDEPAGLGCSLMA